VIVQADGIIWDLAEAKRLLDAGRVMIGEACFLHRLRQHLGEVRDLAFSPRNDYLCTLGGQDDNALVVWHVASGEALCGAPAASESALCCRWLNRRNDRIVTGGYYHVRVWQMDQRSPKLHPIDAKLGTLRRIATCVSITDDDECAYFGTNTGDVVKVLAPLSRILLEI
jgi:WD40 repeat protein